MTTHERRSYFRVDQDIMFEYRSADVHMVESDNPEAAFNDEISMQMISELRKIDRDANQTLKIISDKNRLLADYLQRLNHKIDLIARYSMFTAGSDCKTQRLNLSEEGIAFVSNKVLYKGNFLALRLIFLPSYIPVIIFAKVIRCQSEGNDHKVAAKFHQLKDNDRQILVRQVLKAQVNDRKQQNKSENPNQ